MRTPLTTLLAAVAVAITALAAPGDAKGTLVYKGKAREFRVALAHAYLLKVPDIVDRTKTLRRIVFSSTDVSARLKACASMICAGPQPADGFTLDLDAGPRLLFWMTINNQAAQYSGTAAPGVLTLTTDTPTRVAGKLSLDSSGAGGPKIDVEFDAAFVK